MPRQRNTIVLVTPLPGYSWALVITGYIDCPGGFGAGYYWYIDLAGPF